MKDLRTIRADATLTIEVSIIMERDVVLMRKVLYINYIFPPLGGSGVHRSLKCVKYLSEFGWQVTVLSADESVSYFKEYSLLKEVPEDIRVHRIGHKEYPKDFDKLRAKLNIQFDFPDAYKFWFQTAYREGKKILQNEKIDLIFTSSAPYTSHFVGMRLSKEFDIPWIAEFRDPWYTNDVEGNYRKKTLISPLRWVLESKIRKAEKKIVETADKTVVVSWHHSQDLCRTHGIPEDKIDVINLGYDEYDFEGLQSHAIYPGKTVITFIGSFYGGFREIALRLVEAVRELNMEIEIVFIGQSSASMQGLGYEELTCIYNIPKWKLLTFCLATDFNVIITLPSSLWHIPGKIYECLRLGRPILAICPEEGDAARIVKEANAGFIVSNDKEQMKKQLHGIFERCKRGEFKDFQPDMDYASQFEYRKLVRELSNVFEDVVNRVSID